MPPAPSPAGVDPYDMQPTREVLKPENQLQLTDAQMDEEVTKQLTAGPAPGRTRRPLVPSTASRHCCDSGAPL
jgi:hypothetical protein